MRLVSFPFHSDTIGAQTQDQSVSSDRSSNGPENLSGAVRPFDATAAVRRAMHLANAVGAAWARDEMMENPRTFKAPAAEQALREFLEQAFAEATGSQQ